MRVGEGKMAVGLRARERGQNARGAGSGGWGECPWQWGLTASPTGRRRRLGGRHLHCRPWGWGTQATGGAAVVPHPSRVGVTLASRRPRVTHRLVVVQRAALCDKRHRTSHRDVIVTSS